MGDCFADFAEVDQPQVLITTLISLISLIFPIIFQIHRAE